MNWKFKEKKIKSDPLPQLVREALFSGSSSSPRGWVGLPSGEQRDPMGKVQETSGWVISYVSLLSSCSRWGEFCVLVLRAEGVRL